MTLDTAKNLAILLVIALIGGAFLVARFVKSVGAKAIIILMLGGMALGVWTQRQALVDCADEVTEKTLSGDFSSTQCTFFGTEVDVDIPGA